MCTMMARCITYFTMLVELLIIKNVKVVGVMLSTRHSSHSDDILKKNKAYICAVTEIEALILQLLLFTGLFPPPKNCMNSIFVLMWQRHDVTFCCLMSVLLLFSLLFTLL